MDTWRSRGREIPSGCFNHTGTRNNQFDWHPAPPLQPSFSSLPSPFRTYFRCRKKKWPGKAHLAAHLTFCVQRLKEMFNVVTMSFEFRRNRDLRLKYQQQNLGSKLSYPSSILSKFKIQIMCLLMTLLRITMFALSSHCLFVFTHLDHSFPRLAVQHLLSLSSISWAIKPSLGNHLPFVSYRKTRHSSYYNGKLDSEGQAWKASYGIILIQSRISFHLSLQTSYSFYTDSLIQLG